MRSGATEIPIGPSHVQRTIGGLSSLLSCSRCTCRVDGKYAQWTHPGLLRVSRSSRLYPAKQKQNDDDDQNCTDDSRWAVAPGVAVTPTWDHAEKGEDQDDDEYGAERHKRNPTMCRIVTGQFRASGSHNKDPSRKFHRGFVKSSPVDRVGRLRSRRERKCLGCVCFAVHRIAMYAITGQSMAQIFSSNCSRSLRSPGAIILAAAMLLSPALFASAASAQALGYASRSETSFSDNAMVATPSQSGLSEEEGDVSSVLPQRLRRAVVAYSTREAPGTVVIDTGNTALYYVLGGNRAIRYGVGVGREGFTWSGVQTISRKAEWPDWHPPAEMIARQPYLPRFMAGGPSNPLGARAMYLGASEYRIHGTNDPSTIGKFVSSGCIRLTNEDVADLFSRVNVGTKVVVLPKTAAHRIEARTVDPRHASPPVRPSIVTARSDRQAMNLTRSGLY